MGVAKYVGRVGALAVAMGVAGAVLTSPGVSFAAPADAGSAGADTAAESTGSGTDAAAADGGAAAQAGLAGTEGSTDAAGSADDSDADTPTVAVSSSGGANGSDADSDNGDDADGDVEAALDAAAAAVTDRIGGTINDLDDLAADAADAAAEAFGGFAGVDSVRDALDAVGTRVAASVSGALTSVDRLRADAADAAQSPLDGAGFGLDNTLSTARAQLSGAAERFSSAVARVSAPISEPATAVGGGTAQPTSVATAAAVSAPVAAVESADPLGAIDEAADAVSGVVSSVLTAALGPLAGGSLPGAPELPSPALWAVAAWVRREIAGLEQSLFGQAESATPQQVATQALAPADLLSLSPGDILTDIVDAFLAATEALRNFVDATLFRPSPNAVPQQFLFDTSGGAEFFTAEFAATTPFPDEGLVYTVNGQGEPGGPQFGTVMVNNDTGEFTYTPDDPSVATVDTFTYIADDDTGPFGIAGHLHLFESFNSPFGILSTNFLGGHRDTATITVFVDPDGSVTTDTISGEITAASYNIAGLPFPNALLQDLTFPRITSTLDISSRLNETHELSDGTEVNFDIVGLQEDFAYHAFVIAATLFPDVTVPQVPDYLWPIGVPVISGINTLSAYEIKRDEQVTWFDCSGTDCWTPKGFSYKQIQLEGGATIDVYNLHADASEGEPTNANIEQLSAYIQDNSRGRAVIVTGDWNAMYSNETTRPALQEFGEDNNLTDAWVLQEHGMNTADGDIPNPGDIDVCDNANNCEQLDKIFFRDAEDGSVTLSLLDNGTGYVGYQNYGLDFQDDEGNALSDHRPVGATLVYTVTNFSQDTIVNV